MNTEALETTEKVQEVVGNVSEQPRWTNDRGQSHSKWRNSRDNRWDRQEKPKKEYDELLLEVRRVTRVTTWWRRLSFRATVLVWNRKWKIGIGTSKGPDVTAAVQKASHEAYKNLMTVSMTKACTVPYPTTLKYKACVVRLLPALSGTGLKAWSSVRSVLELAWYQNVLSKIMWSNNKLNNAIATVKALSTYKHAAHFDKMLNTKNDEAATTKKTVEKSEETKVVEKVVSTEKKPVVKKPAAKKS